MNKKVLCDACGKWKEEVKNTMEVVELILVERRVRVKVLKEWCEECAKRIWKG